LHAAVIVIVIADESAQRSSSAQNMEDPLPIIRMSGLHPASEHSSGPSSLGARRTKPDGECWGVWESRKRDGDQSFE